MKALPLFLLLLCTLPLLAADDKKFPQWDNKQSIQDYAKSANLQATLTLNLGDGVTWEGVLAPAGTFTMGSPESEGPGRQPAEKQHKVTLTKPFYIGKFELTQKQYEKVTGQNPSTIKGDDLPVANLTAADAQDFCDKMSKLTGKAVKLPTEAQWEYACRAGTTTAYNTGEKPEDLERAAWFGANSDKKPHPVGQKAPNNWGLYDMHGNIREYTRDLYKPDPQPDATDPEGPKDGDTKNHVVRGGAFTANALKAGNCRSASRRPTEGKTLTGFRIIVEID
jgi:formylglycine-generating enzyme required for sulfatase activity